MLSSRELISEWKYLLKVLADGFLVGISHNPKAADGEKGIAKQTSRHVVKQIRRGFCLQP